MLFRSTGYYLYEASRDGAAFADRILREVGRVAPINRDHVIDGRRSDGNGLITRPATLAALRRRPQWPMAYHVFQNHADHLIGSETSQRVGLARRVRAHHRALEVALEMLTTKAKP